MTGPAPDPLEQLRERLAALPDGEVRTGTVAGFGERGDVLVRLDGDDPRAPTGSIPRHLLSRTAFEDPGELVSVGQRITAEVFGVDERSGLVTLSAKACEDEALYRYLRGRQRGDIVTGTVAAVHDFGVFVRLDGEPGHPAYPGTGFIRVPDLSWSRIDHPEEVVRPGQRVTGAVVVIDTDQGEVVVSLKALQEDPWDGLAASTGDVVTGPVTEVTPFGVLVRVGEAAQGLVHESDLDGQAVREGQELAVRIVEIDRVLRRIRLAPAG
ncbi:S1 RNA-binding domain-containing protein [Streptomyces sp. NPDC016566]|uniref:S1 RNA-binding domain-containing protein n=1 Tax=unclassified Streptomyces TaxID=2593676 RepID=UPI0011A7D93C|nr:S1 RNA-binding domain-containing protein [Streptomyces sp. BK340]TVZ91999.1 small subunit ribosomal protein S1 [Streptomyces sp. BK340]